jgi:GWxTD domain-containing protein
MKSIRLHGLAPALFLAAAGALGAAWPSATSKDWADSPDAYFLTSDEIQEWQALSTDDAKKAFVERYWLKRDPTTGTEKNEFRELVLGRIKTADDRFGIEKTPGSRTARGFVFIVFGSPARVRDEHAAPTTGGFVGAPGGSLEGNETITHWIYDRERTPRVLEALDRPTLEVSIIVEPFRHSDSIESPGLVKELREKLARQTIVNPDAVAPAAAAAAAPPAPAASTSAPAPAPPAPAAAAPAAPAPLPLPRDVLDAALRASLEQAPFVSRSGDAVFGDAMLWRDTGGARTLVWFSLPPPAGAAKLSLHGVVRKENGGEEVASFNDASPASDVFTSAGPGQVLLRQLDLPPGAYDGYFAVTDSAGGKPVASAAAKLTVPDLATGFSVSPLLLTRGPAARTPENDGSPFALGQGVLPPRADATFAPSESLWFYVECANPPDPAKATLELRLRKGTENVRQQAAFPAQFAPVGPHRYIAGFEIPLAKVPPGDYRLYVMVRDGVSPPDQYALRSADFRVK